MCKRTDFKRIACCAVADYAARASLPIVRFFHESYRPEDFEVARERPVALVFANQSDADRFYYVEEAPRIILPLARMEEKDAKAYSEISAALAAAQASRQAAAPAPSILQVHSLLLLTGVCHFCPVMSGPYPPNGWHPPSAHTSALLH